MLRRLVVSGLTLCLSVSSLRADVSISFFDTVKAVDLTQTSELPPTDSPNWFAYFRVFWDGSFTDPNKPNEPNDPNGPPTIFGPRYVRVSYDSPLSPIMLDVGNFSHIGFVGSWLTKGELDDAVPNGDYTFTLARGFGPEDATITIPGDLYARQPRLVDETHTFLQGMDPTRDFEFRINGFEAVPGANFNATYLFVFEQGGSTSVHADAWFSDPGRQEFIIPADTLQPNTAYLAYVTYSSRLETPDAGFGGTSSVIFDMTTRADFTTGGGALPGDVDGDGDVDLTDLAILLSSFGLCSGAGGFDARADFHGDNCVNLTDLATLLTNFGL
ncbi:MAG: dockerin type I domain-containing protein [Phycisphaerae bacterium]